MHFLEACNLCWVASIFSACSPGPPSPVEPNGVWQLDASSTLTRLHLDLGCYGSHTGAARSEGHVKRKLVLTEAPARPSQSQDQTQDSTEPGPRLPEGSPLPRQDAPFTKAMGTPRKAPESAASPPGTKAMWTWSDTAGPQGSHWVWSTSGTAPQGLERVPGSPVS